LRQGHGKGGEGGRKSVNAWRGQSRGPLRGPLSRAKSCEPVGLFWLGACVWQTWGLDTQCWGWIPGPHTCQVSALPLNYIASPGFSLIHFIENDGNKP
jgi:hypothetical protein